MLWFNNDPGSLKTFWTGKQIQIWKGRCGKLITLGRPRLKGDLNHLIILILGAKAISKVNNTFGVWIILFFSFGCYWWKEENHQYNRWFRSFEWLCIYSTVTYSCDCSWTWIMTVARHLILAHGMIFLLIRGLKITVTWLIC